MCRIFGVCYGDHEEPLSAGGISRVMFRALFHGGRDAYGFMRYDGEDILYCKQPGRADDPDVLDSLYEMIGKDTRWVVGHVRKATYGSPEVNSNNHPIVHGNIIGVHNGTLKNHDDILTITGREFPTTTVDSEAIFAAVNRWGHLPGLRKILGDMVAVYADVRKPHLLHFARSQNRSLIFGWTKRGNLIFSSERQALYRLEHYGVRYEGFSQIKENRHLVVKEANVISRTTYRTAPDPSISPYFVSRELTGPVTTETLTKPLETPGSMMYFVNEKWLSEDEFIEKLANESRNDAETV